jgi:cobyric acid synthase
VEANITQTTAPTTAEVSQSEAANADADTEANRLLKVKKRGRSQSIMTGSKGVTKTSTDYSLGKKSLLGRV